MSTTFSCSSSPAFPQQTLRFESFDRIKEGLHLQLVEFYEQGVEATEEMHLQDFDQERHFNNCDSPSLLDNDFS